MIESFKQVSRKNSNKNFKGIQENQKIYFMVLLTVLADFLWNELKVLHKNLKWWSRMYSGYGWSQPISWLQAHVLRQADL